MSLTETYSSPTLHAGQFPGSKPGKSPVMRVPRAPAPTATAPPGQSVSAGSPVGRPAHPQVPRGVDPFNTGAPNAPVEKEKEQSTQTHPSGSPLHPGQWAQGQKTMAYLDIARGLLGGDVKSVIGVFAGVHKTPEAYGAWKQSTTNARGAMTGRRSDIQREASSTEQRRSQRGRSQSAVMTRKVAGLEPRIPTTTTTAAAQFVAKPKMRAADMSAEQRSEIKRRAAGGK